MDIPEPEILEARRSFPDTQAAMASAGVPALFGPDFYTVAWKGHELTDTPGSFCTVNADGPLANLVGDHLRLRFGASRSVYVYCVGSATLAVDIGVTRRAFAALEFLAVDSLAVLVEVVS